MLTVAGRAVRPNNQEEPPVGEANEAGRSNAENVIAMVGLAIGGLFGILGTFLARRNLQAACRAIDGVGLIVATVILALEYFRRGLTGGRTSDGQHSRRIRPLGAPGGGDSFHSVCDCFGKDLLGETDSAECLAAALLCLPFSCPRGGWLDLEAAPLLVMPAAAP